MRRRIIAIALFFCLAPTACADPKSAKIGKLPTAVAPVARLRADLDRIFSNSRLSNTLSGIEIYSLDRSESVYERDSSRLLMPASNNKILTVCTALMRLGPDFKIKTRVSADGLIKDGVLEGSLIVSGSGDPTNAPRFHSGNPFGVFREWSAKLKALSIHKVNGDLVGDELDFDEMLGKGWEWNDLPESFAAPVSSLQFNENMLLLEISPGTRKGDPATIRTSPLRDFLKLENSLTTGSEETPLHIDINQTEEGVAVHGTIPCKSPVVSRAVSVRDPVRYYLQALKDTLSAEGIDVASCGLKKTKFHDSAATLLWVDESPTLSEIIKPILKLSQNLYAETLARILGTELRKSGAFPAGKEIVEETLSGMGIVKGSFSYADASGLSRLNLVSPDSLVRILRTMYARPEFALFNDALPIAGVDGTLAGRMKGTRAENKVHAKTGSLANVSCISGYVRTSDDEMLAFSMMFNHFLAPRDVIEALQDKALERLANFSRK
jgi:serine-type D-Ala-D-Ala carboxypeptidase/endopeptidase (penicillin-binding protein 4)